MRDSRIAFVPYIILIAVVVAILAVVFAYGQTPQDSTSGVTSITVPNTAVSSFPIIEGDAQAIRITNDKGEMVVSIGMDGKVEMGKNVKPDEAARTFWTQISKVFPQVCAEVKDVGR